MSISSPIRTRASAGRGVFFNSRAPQPARFLNSRAPQPARWIGFSALACLFIACSDDDPAQQTEPTGSSVTTPDASVRDLRGDGLLPTPESDIDDRQREPIGPERLAEEAEGIRNSLGGAGGQSTGARDAGTDDGGGDASTD